MGRKEKLRLFLDSDVILSGLFSEKGAPRLILDLLSLGFPMLKGITGEYNIMEIERNLHKKLSGALPLYHKYLSVLDLEIIPLPPLEEIKRLAGHIADKDIPVLASAIAARADFLITGDKKDFSKGKVKGKYYFQILSPSEFLDIIVPELLGTQEIE
ncbi:MAG: PIN domain-containing protein [Nitrospirota bacterium]